MGRSSALLNLLFLTAPFLIGASVTLLFPLGEDVAVSGPVRGGVPVSAWFRAFRVGKGRHNSQRQVAFVGLGRHGNILPPSVPCWLRAHGRCWNCHALLGALLCHKLKQASVGNCTPPLRKRDPAAIGGAAARRWVHRRQIDRIPITSAPSAHSRRRHGRTSARRHRWSDRDARCRPAHAGTRRDETACRR